MLNDLMQKLRKAESAARLFDRRLARAEIARVREELRARDPKNLALYGFSVYSQADEDGILEEILKRVDIPRGRFLEIGAGDGLENNTAYLLAKGWEGVWVEADPKRYNPIKAGLSELIASHQLRLFT